MLLMSHFFLSLHVFYLSGELSAVFIKILNFQFGIVQNLLFGKGLRMCRFQVDCSLIVEVVLDRVENMEGKGENAGNELVDFRQCRFVDCVHCINYLDWKREDFGLSNSVCL